MGETSMAHTFLKGIVNASIFTPISDVIKTKYYLGCSLQGIEIDDDGFDLTSYRRRIIHCGHGILGPTPYVDEQLVLIVADGHGDDVAIQLDHLFWQ